MLLPFPHCFCLNGFQLDCSRQRLWKEVEDENRLAGLLLGPCQAALVSSLSRAHTAGVSWAQSIFLFNSSENILTLLHKVWKTEGKPTPPTTTPT